MTCWNGSPPAPSPEPAGSGELPGDFCGARSGRAGAGLHHSLSRIGGEFTQRERHIIRIYDILFDQDVLLKSDAFLRRVLQAPEFQRTMSTAELHYNLGKPEGSDDAAFRARADELARVVYDVTAALTGSISAEHGIGTAKRDLLADYEDPLELELMRGVKALLDPAGLMNPCKVLPAG